MDIKLLIIFIILNIVNVVIQTIKSIATIKCGKLAASAVNALAYGLYTIVTVYMLCELPLMWKAGIVALCNLVGVYVVKLCEEKARKDKLWKVEATLSNQNLGDDDDCIIALKANKIPTNYIEAGKYLIINCYCATQKDSQIVKMILDKYNAKYFVSESKTL